jgi:DNA-binding Lrp family transcriptional regulator
MASVLLTIEGNVDATLLEVAELAGVEILFRTSGSYQAVAEVTAPSESAVLDLVDRQISAVPGVRSTSLQIYTAIKKLPSQWRFEAL